jgi:hypothetical protein
LPLKNTSALFKLQNKKVPQNETQWLLCRARSGLFAALYAATADIPTNSLMMFWGAHKCDTSVKPFRIGVPKSGVSKRQSQPPCNDTLPSTTTLLNPWVQLDGTSFGFFPRPPLLSQPEIDVGFTLRPVKKGDNASYFSLLTQQEMVNGSDKNIKTYTVGLVNGQMTSVAFSPSGDDCRWQYAPEKGLLVAGESQIWWLLVLRSPTLEEATRNLTTPQVWNLGWQKGAPDQSKFSPWRKMQQ